MLESGQTQEAINRFTSQPKMLPLLDFYATLDSAAALDSDSIAAAESDSSISNFTFRQWSSQFPKASAPIRRGLQEFNQRDGEYAMFSFNLVGMDRANRWYRGRYKRNISSPQNLELVRQQISSSVDMVELAESIKDFHYRPKFINGEPQTVNATLVFQLAD